MEMEEGSGNVELSESRFKELQANEQYLLTVSVKGFGKRTSAYEYRLSGRGGQGVTNMGLTEKNGAQVIATFPVTDDHQIMLVTDGGQLIRTPVNAIRFTGRSAQGVTIFKVAEGEKVVSVAWLIDEEGDDEPQDSPAAE
jgi:DNA gyrase subunit A